MDWVNLLVSAYGPYGFGLAMFLVMWFAVVRPELREARARRRRPTRRTRRSRSRNSRCPTD